MATFWKGLLVALLTLPVGAYVTGSLAGSQLTSRTDAPPW